MAQDNNISTGAISNITNEWSIALGKPEADVLRELARSLKITQKLSHTLSEIHTRDAKILESHQVN
jgi:hypothetical protein